MQTRRRCLRTLIASLSLGLLGSTALAQAPAGYPSKPIRMIVPLAAGSAQGLTPRGTTPDELGTAMRAQLTRYGQLIKQAGITAD